MLDHPLIYVSRTGFLGCLSGSMYENVYKIFKEVYAHTSKRSQSAMDETVRRQEEEDYIPNHLRNRALSDISKHVNVRIMQSLKEDSAFLVQSGMSVNFIELETAANILYNIKNG